MMKNESLKVLIALLFFACMFAAGPVNAGYLGFTADSLRTEASDDC